MINLFSKGVSKIRKHSFDVFLPIDTVEKSGDDDNTYTVAGYASDSHRDLQGESIDPAGIDASYLISDGFVDYEHDTDQVIGVPTKNTHVDSKGLFLEAKLFKNMPQVQSIIKLYHNIKDNNIDRHLGFSIEGNVIERDEDDESIIRQVQITGVAVTKNPANTDATWELVSKSLFSPKPLDSASHVKNDNNPMLAMTVKVNKSKDTGDSFHSSTYCYSFDDPTGKKSGHSLKEAENKGGKIKEPKDVIVGGKKVASVNNQVDKALLAGHGITPATQSNGAAFRTEQFSDQLVSLAQNLKQAREIGLSSIGQTVAQILADKQADDESLTVFLQLFEGLSYTDANMVVSALNTNELTDSRLEHILDGADDVTEDADDDD